jgi:hypothetical protein
MLTLAATSPASSCVPSIPPLFSKLSIRAFSHRIETRSFTPCKEGAMIPVTREGGLNGRHKSMMAHSHMGQQRDYDDSTSSSARLREAGGQGRDPWESRTSAKPIPRLTARSARSDRESRMEGGLALHHLSFPFFFSFPFSFSFFFI